VGEIWCLRYHDEINNFPVKGNQFIRWLAKLLEQRNCPLTVAELYGDPGGKLAADASLGGEDTQDRESLQATYKRMEDIQTIIADTGGSEELEAELEELVRQVGKSSERMKTGIGRAYHNIATQKRMFLQKIQEQMPELRAHLRTYIHQEPSGYTFCYRPPDGTLRWQIEIPPA
jgi:hypothetical protein